jgi:hypothetical protein
MTEDARHRFDEDVFTHRITKDGRILIAWSGRVVTTVAGKDAERLVARLRATEDRRAVQQLLARATGNFRRGNER